MAVAILDKHEFLDGRIVLYRRGDIGDNSSYSVRLRIPTTTGYVIRSSGTSDLFEARKFAEGLYDELRLKVLNGETLRDKAFDETVAQYVKDLTLQPFKSEKDRAEVIAYFANYPVRYFGKKPLTKIDDQAIDDFVSWRFTNSVRKSSVQVNSVRAELNTLKKFFIWAKRKKLISSIPDIRKPKAGKNRRPHFDDASWRKVTRQLREYIKHDNPIVVRDRVMLVNYVLILANTGIRVGEARTLKWRDISDISPEKGSNEPANIAVYVKGKTGAREVVSRTPDVKIYFARILELRRNELGEIDPALDSYVFCHKDGTPIKSFKKSFNALLKCAGAEMDSGGQRRTIYSLRHTYATFRLHEGVNHFILARNMGTSVAMLEAFYGHTSNIASAKELTKNSGYNSSAKTRSLDWLSK